jgi:hypothetical protein
MLFLMFPYSCILFRMCLSGSAYATPILNNMHEYGNIKNNMTLLKQINKGPSMNCLEQFSFNYMHKTKNWYKSKTRENTTQYSDSFPRDRDVTSTCDIDLLITRSITSQLVLSQTSTSEHITEYIGMYRITITTSFYLTEYSTNNVLYVLDTDCNCF